MSLSLANIRAIASDKYGMAYFAIHELSSTPTPTSHTLPQVTSNSKSLSWTKGSHISITSNTKQRIISFFSQKESNTRVSNSFIYTNGLLLSRNIKAAIDVMEYLMFLYDYNSVSDPKFQLCKEVMK